MPSVWVLLLNWRNGRDTVECLQSLLDCGGAQVRGVVLCDNDSGDDSFALVASWAAESGVALRLAAVAEALTGVAQVIHGSSQAPWDLHFVQTGANLGFAGGNNVGLRYIRSMAQPDEAVFLLNNDTLLTEGAIDRMLARLCQGRTGMCGATVVYHHGQRRVQAYGGARFQPWLGRARHLGAHAAFDVPRDPASVEPQLDYVLGAALMIRGDCLNDVGLLDDRYFLYYEEIDWATRARRMGYDLGWAPDAVVFHKEGATIGSSSNGRKRSLLSEYHMVRSSLLFTRKFYPYYLPTVVAFILLKSLQMIFHNDLARAAVRTRALLGLSRAP
nr:glycosyltransferase family 2 protein [Rubrivivax albus]